jgi:hypothetical protein
MVRRLTSPPRLTPSARARVSRVAAAWPRWPSGVWVLVDPRGRSWTVTGLKPFCRTHGLHPSHLRTYGRSKGWTGQRIGTQAP